MISRFKETLEKARAKTKSKLEAAMDRIRGFKDSITRQRIMNILGVYVDEDSEEEVEYDNALKEIFYDFLLWLYGDDCEEDEEYVN